MPTRPVYEDVKDRGLERPVFDLPTNDLLDRQARIESNPRTYPRRILISLHTGQGIYVTDTEGRRYIDCLAGAGVLALGHRHPVVVETVQRPLYDGLPWQTLDLTTTDRDAERATLPRRI